jgi:serine/threonine protein phosphatase PrpC
MSATSGATSGRVLLERLALDHSVVGQLVGPGMLTPEQARHHQDRGKLQQAAGLPRGIKPDLNSRRLMPRDSCSALTAWGRPAEEGISVVLASEGSMRQLATVLVERALAAGADDNINGSDVLSHGRSRYHWVVRR